MSRKLSFRPWASMAVALAALAVALGGVTFASIPGPEGVLKACYDNSTGALRAIDSTASCAGGETQTSLISVAGLNLLRPYGAFTVANGRVHIVDSSGIAGVTRLSRGKFCVTPKAGFHVVSSVVSAGYDPNNVALAYTKVGNPDCARGSLEVITGVIQRGAFVLKDEAFVADPTG
jgi:hypothetical protein